MVKQTASKHPPTTRELLDFFRGDPLAVALYEYIQTAILGEFPEVTVTVMKTQIAFTSKSRFAYVWTPIHAVRGRPEHYVVLTFGLRRPLSDPLVVSSAQPYPGRYTHHVLIADASALDSKIACWLREARDATRSKSSPSNTTE